MEKVFTEMFFYTIAVLAVVIPVLTNAINKLLNFSGGWKQFLSFIVALFAVAITYFLNLLYYSTETLATLNQVELIISISSMVLFSGFVSNGIYDIPQIKTFLNMLFPPKIE